MYAAITCTIYSQDSGNFEQNLLAISAEEWHIHLNKIKADTSFLKRVIKKS